MNISASYVCPTKGLASLEPPDIFRFGQAAKAAKSLGLEKLLLPILEASLLGSVRSKVYYLDGLIRILDQATNADLPLWLIAPARRVLGLDWVPTYMVGPASDPTAAAVYVDGKVRNLRPFHWWSDPLLIEKRIRIFHELVSAVAGHPALTGWVILDRALDWSRPDQEVADLVLKAYVTEIRERDEDGAVYMGLDGSELLRPELVRGLASQVDGLRIGGLEKRPDSTNIPVGPRGDLLLAGYAGLLSQWLFNRPTEINLGWSVVEERGDPEAFLEAFTVVAQLGIPGTIWANLIDPEPRLFEEPPWVLRPDLKGLALLDSWMEPKGGVEGWLDGIRSVESKDDAYDFIDLTQQEYMEDPHLHFFRLWDHFKDVIR